MDLPPLPEGSRLRAEEDADALKVSYAVRGGPAARLLLIGLILASMGIFVLCHPWEWNPSTILAPGAPAWVRWVMIGRGGILLCLIIFPLALLIILNQVRSSGNTELHLSKEGAVFDIGGGAGVVLVRRKGIRSIRTSPSGRIWIRCRWAIWPFSWLSFDLLPGTFRPPALQDAKWIEKVLAQWAGLAT